MAQLRAGASPPRGRLSQATTDVEQAAEPPKLSTRHKLGCALTAAAMLLIAPVGFMLWVSNPGSPHDGPIIEGYCEAAAAQRPLAPDTSNQSEIALWARGLVGQMTAEEKHLVVNGFAFGQEGSYIGNVPAIPRLGLPSINMHDAAQGFRTLDARTIGQVTSWPCALALSASWDTNATWHWAQAIGKEFQTKGANVILGPAVNVHRVATNGRNAEYLSGEDPFLGSGLADAYVRGVQDAGVAAVVKHFALNQQETNRTKVDAHVDERTLWELYYPPFQAAVDAGVAAAMCSYNSVNGEQACDNPAILSQDLKGRMGFQGWVMSDWWALQSKRSALSGTDQDMPGTDGHFSSAALSALPAGRLDEMATRVLQGVARARAFRDPNVTTCRVGCDCGRLLYAANATSEDHVSLARHLAAQAAVLLKNEPAGNASRELLRGGRHSRILPLRPEHTIALVGSACAAKPVDAKRARDWKSADYYVVGGSGRVLSPHVVSVLEGLRSRGLRLHESISDSVGEAETVALQSDVVVVCAGATTSEDEDRSSLRLDQDDFVQAVLDRLSVIGVPTVVVALVPGAVVLPWRDNATAILLLLLSGQETGNAVADVLLGTSGPSGRLPVTLPVNETDAIHPCAHGLRCTYSERLRAGWHVYDDKEVAYPFGHGLSYGSFEYSLVQDWVESTVPAQKWTILVNVTNVGHLAGVEVLQLYLRFPSMRPKQSTLQLRGFRKTPTLSPGESHDVEFALAARDLSQWDVRRHAWSLATGQFETFIGSSSRDPRLCGGFGGKAVLPTRPCSAGQV